MMIILKQDNTGFLKKLFGKIPKNLKKNTQYAFALWAVNTVSHVRTTYFGGSTTPSRLKNRSSVMSKRVKPQPVKTTKEKITGGFSFGTIYSAIHIGKKGTTTTIRPKNKKYLTIPLPAALTQGKKGGVLRGSAQSGIWGNTFIRKSKKGNLIIFGARNYQKGKKAGQAANRIDPLFVLKKKVTIPARIDPEDILKWALPKIIKEIKQGKLLK